MCISSGIHNRNPVINKYVITAILPVHVPILVKMKMLFKIVNFSIIVQLSLTDTLNSGHLYVLYNGQ